MTPKMKMTRKTKRTQEMRMAEKKRINKTEDDLENRDNAKMKTPQK